MLAQAVSTNEVVLAIFFIGMAGFLIGLLGGFLVGTIREGEKRSKVLCRLIKTYSEKIESRRAVRFLLGKDNNAALQLIEKLRLAIFEGIRTHDRTTGHLWRHYVLSLEHLDKEVAILHKKSFEEVLEAISEHVEASTLLWPQKYNYNSGQQDILFPSLKTKYQKTESQPVSV